jgi:tetratricopeptide (TPR) repeat protein
MAISLAPSIAAFYRSRGITYGSKGEYDKTISDFKKAIELNPKDPTTYRIFAKLLATCSDEKYRDGIKAIALVSKAIELSSKKDMFYDTAAEAYAESGNFQEAIKMQEKAIFFATEEEKTNGYFEKLLTQLKSYKENKPWRETLPLIRKSGEPNNCENLQ